MDLGSLYSDTMPQAWPLRQLDASLSLFRTVPRAILPTLTKLCVRGTPIDDPGILLVALHCSTLQSLDISCCVRVTEASVVPLIEASAHLEHLDLCYATSIASAHSVLLAGVRCGCPLLSIGVSGHSTVTDDTVDAISCCDGGVRKLSHLALGDCSAVSSASLRMIAARCSALRTLTLVDMPQISDADLLSFAASMPCLVGVDARMTGSDEMLIPRCVPGVPAFDCTERRQLGW